MPSSELMKQLNAILRWEWTGVSQYAQYSFVVTGAWREVYAEKFMESAKESFQHAETIGEKISAMGGVPDVEREPVKQTADFQQMLQNSLQFEQTAVDLYTATLALADEEDRALAILLEDILLEEQEGVDDLTKILRETGQAAMSNVPAQKTA